jgi:hypothetical protein
MSEARRMTFDRLIDVDNVSTWPDKVRNRAEDWAQALRDGAECTSDLDLDKEDEDEFRRLLAGSMVLAFHATRLLDHEVESIRNLGLRLASEDLVRLRVETAVEAGSVDSAFAQQLLRANVFAERDARNRQRQVCLVLSRRPFDESPHGFTHLLGEWGGEVITMSRGGVALRPRLQRLGRPAIVAAAIDLSAPWRVHAVWPSLHKVFVAAVLGLEDLGADVFYRQRIPPEHILSIWQPGDAEYDEYPHLVNA